MARPAARGTELDPAETARRIIQAAEASGQVPPASVRDVARSISRWEGGTNQPSERYRLLYCEIYGIPRERFGVPALKDDKADVMVIPDLSTEESRDQDQGHRSRQLDAAVGRSLRTARAAR